MTEPNGFAAGILEASAAGYGGAAASLLLEREPELEERWGSGAFGAWKANLTHRIIELAAALRAGEVEIFASRVDWERRALLARDLDPGDLATSLRCLREVLLDQLPSAARDGVSRALDAGMAVLEREPDLEEKALDPENGHDRLALEYLADVLDGDVRKGVGRVLEAVDDGLGVQDAYLRVLLPAQREVGRMWHAGTVSVAEEHLVTGTTERVMAVLGLRAEAAEPHGRRALVAGVEGNAHEIALMALRDLLEIAGWQVLCLGADVPTADLVNAVRAFEPDAVFLSGSLSTQVGAASTALRALRQLDEAPAVIVGGAAFDEAPDLGPRLGADAYGPDVEAAMEAAERLTS